MSAAPSSDEVPAPLSVDGGAINQRFQAKITDKTDGTPSFDRASMVGTVLESYEDADIPFLWFSSIGQFWSWFIEWAIPGLGMFCEAYFIFSIGNIKPMLTYEYPECWKTYQECSKNLTNAPEYTQIIGIILGMCFLGAIGDRIGRKRGSIITASIMLLGAIMLTVMNGATPKGFTIMYIISQLIFGFGVGGEYPMAAGSAAERAEAGGAAMAKKRGREVVLTFSMQGVGNFVNTGVLIILLVIFQCAVPNHSNPQRPYAHHLLSGVWRTAFGLGIIPLCFIIFWRVFKLQESAVWAANRGRDRKRETRLLFRHFWHRLVATCGCWFLWDFSFYGNKVFQSEFIQILSPGASLLTTLLWTLLNSGCALVGYYFTAALVDNPMVGRNRIQVFGFLGVGTLFMVSAGAYGPLTTKGGIGTFQFIYFFSSFVGQFGPNCTTFLLAGELYPTEVRTTAHGLSAGVAKCGALWASVWFSYLEARTKFWLTASFNFGGALLTLLFMPDPLRLSLTELDRRFSCLMEGRAYHGEAINPRGLSLWERLTRTGEGKPYHGKAIDPWGFSVWDRLKRTGKGYDPEMDSVDMLREKIPDWRINSLARHSATPSVTAHDHDV